MSLLDFADKFKVSEGETSFGDIFNIVKKADGSEVDLRKMVWLSEYHKVFFDESESGIETIRSKFQINKGSRKTKDGPKTIFFLERTDYWKDFGPASCDAEHKTIDGALSEFYGEKDLIEALIKHDALSDGRYFWKYRAGEWRKDWVLEDDTVAVASNSEPEQPPQYPYDSAAALRD